VCPLPPQVRILRLGSHSHVCLVQEHINLLQRRVPATEACATASASETGSPSFLFRVSELCSPSIHLRLSWSRLPLQMAVPWSPAPEVIPRHFCRDRLALSDSETCLPPMHLRQSLSHCSSPTTYGCSVGSGTGDCCAVSFQKAVRPLSDSETWSPPMHLRSWPSNTDGCNAVSGTEGCYLVSSETGTEQAVALCPSIEP
jgi:hypothetical protein